MFIYKKIALLILTLFPLSLSYAQISWDKELLQISKQKYLQKDQVYKKAVDLILEEARVISIKGKTFSVARKNIVSGISADKHDFVSMAPYYWPNPKTKDRLPYIQIDGKTNPEVKAIPDLAGLRNLAGHLRTLSLAYYFAGNEEFANYAEKLLTVWFVDSETKMNPNFDYSQFVRGRSIGRSTGIVDATEFVDILNSVSLLQEGLSNQLINELQTWFSQYLNWLNESRVGKGAASLENNIGTSFHLQRLVYSKFLSNGSMNSSSLNSMISLLHSQFGSSGMQKHELTRMKPLNYSLLNVSYWFAIWTVIKNDPARYQEAKNIENTLGRAVFYMETSMKDKQTYRNRIRINNIKRALALKHREMKLSDINNSDDAFSLVIGRL